MKKKISFLFVLLTGLSCNSLNASLLKVVVTNHEASNELKLMVEQKSVAIPLDASGVGQLDLSAYPAAYASLFYGPFAPKDLWIDPSKDLTVEFDAKTWKDQILFKEDNAPINNYLNSGKLSAIQIDDTKYDEMAFIEKSDSLFEANKNVLLAAELPADFMEKELKRLIYFSYTAFPYFEKFHIRITKDTAFVASNVYWDKLKDLTVLDNPQLLDYKEYKSFIVSSVNELAQHTDKNEGNRSLTDMRLDYVTKNIQCAPVADYLVYEFLYYTLMRGGVTALSQQNLDVFHRVVTTPARLDKFNALYEQFNKIAVGKVSPALEAIDRNGKNVTLADYAGKYVYIDIWATWCGPCRKEAPFLQKLEEKYAGKDICFLSVSCDQNKKAWENAVKNRAQESIQLYIGNDNSFMKDYVINGIPRFILLDKEGKILNSDMTRPSEQATTETLDKLLN